jgi:diguanylate cyclase (GGDEF)-like protein
MRYLVRSVNAHDGRAFPRLRIARDRTPEAGYLIASVVLIAGYPLLPSWARAVDVVVTPFMAISAVVIGLRKTRRGDRQPWWLLLAALVVSTASNAIILGHQPSLLATNTSYLLGPVAMLLYLVAAITLIVRQGSGSLTAIIDTALFALSLGGLLWIAFIAPHLAEPFHAGVPQVGAFISVFMLSGMAGALGRLLQLIGKPISALWLLMVSLVLALASYVIEVTASSTHARPLPATLLFIGVYASIGLFGLDPGAPQLMHPAAGPRKEGLCGRRLVFLGAAVSALPIVLGVSALQHGSMNGLIAVIGGPFIAALVMVRIGHVAAQRDRAEAALRFEATHDSLTGLPNRREFVATVERHLSHQGTCAILFCDLDGFKAVNDCLGHQAGDDLLVELGRRLRASEPANNLVSRFGGDEFVIMVPDPTDATIEIAYRCVANALDQPIVVHGEPITLTASIGSATCAAGADPEDSIQRADHAMYEAKRNEPGAAGIRSRLNRATP